MSQHDTVIANAVGSAFRADINSALLAIFSSNSGVSSPVITLAYMIWADSTSGQLKIRNSANTAWVSLGDMSQLNLGLLSTSGGVMSGLIQEKQSQDIASGATVDLSTATGNSVKITHSSGSQSITSFASASAIQEGAVIDLEFIITGGSLTLVHNLTTLFIPGSANLVLANKDKLRVKKTSNSSANWDVVSATKADGTSLISSAGSSSDYVGEIFDWPLDSTPAHGLLCDGSAVSRVTYVNLFNKIGINFGNGDGSTTFNLPNIPEYYTTCQGNNTNNAGGSTVGAVISHSHTSGIASEVALKAGPTGPSTNVRNLSSSGYATGLNGASENRPAAMYVRKCIRIS